MADSRGPGMQGHPAVRGLDLHGIPSRLDLDILPCEAGGDAVKGALPCDEAVPLDLPDLAEEGPKPVRIRQGVQLGPLLHQTVQGPLSRGPMDSHVGDALHAWDARLTGAALEPLLELLVIMREKETAETTERLDMVLALAAGLALMAIAIWGVAGFLLPTLTCGGPLSG